MASLPKKLKSGAGFTLIELMIVTIIVGLLAGFMLLNYRGGSQGLSERRSLSVIAQAVRTAQTKALGAEKNCLSGASKPISCAFYGAHFVLGARNIVVFGSDDAQYSAAKDTEIAVVQLEKNVSIAGLSSSYVCGASAVCFDILFSPPDPTVRFNPGSGPATVTLTGGRSVTIGKGGSVDIN